jgi:hypothetical protein
MCDGNRLLRNAQGTIEQLRAEENGRHTASVYGMVTLESEIAMEDGYYHPLANVTVRLRSGTKSYETKTDRFGAYAFQTLPPGTYDVSADLPSNLEQGKTYGYPALTFELPPRSSWEQNVYAFPKGRILGRVGGPDGKQLRSASVELHYAKQYQEGKPGAYAYQGEWRTGEEWRPFEYQHLPAGDYVVVFTGAQQENPDAPFQRTTRLIHLDDGQQIMNADIQLSDPRPTRKITVRLRGPVSETDDHYPPMVVVTASAGIPPQPFPDGEGTYTLNLLLNTEYAIHGEAFCRTKGKLVTNSATVNGSDLSVSEAISFSSRIGAAKNNRKSWPISRMEGAHKSHKIFLTRRIIGCYLQRRLWSDLRLADYTSLGLINVAPLITGKALDVHAWRIACASKSTPTHTSPP